MEAHSRVEKAPKYYLHTTRSLPFLCAEHIAMICLYSLWKFVSKIPFSPSNFVNSFQHFLRDMGSSLQYLDLFPGYLCYDLEKRIKPKYMLHKWLVEQGFCEKEYCLFTIIASSEKTFNARISHIHPAAAKKSQESSLNKDGRASCQENSVP